METATETETRVYRVPDANLSELEARIEKLNKRAAKLGCEPIVLNITGHEDVEEKKQDPRFPGRIRRYHFITVNGDAPRINGWAFVAKLQHVAAGEDGGSINLLKIVPGYEQELPLRFRSADSQNCDHCHTTRRRNDTFVLQSTGTPDVYKQVGRNCLVDFLGHQSPDAYAAAAEFLFSASDLCHMAEDEGFGGGGYGRSLYQLDWFLSHVSAAIRIEGWLSRGQARLTNKQSTVDSVIAWTLPKQVPDCFRDWTVEDSDKARAAATIEWMRTLASRDNLSDYLYNLSAIAGLEAIDERMFGLAGSAVSTFAREQEKEIERRKRAEFNKDSAHFGTIGKREVFTLTLEFMRELESEWGVTYLQKFRDAAGNVAVWFGSSTLDKWDDATQTLQTVEIGQVVTVKATVKDHNEREGVKQTILSRVALFAPKAPKGKKSS